MKVLFVSSGNSGQVSPIIKAQSESLKEKNIDLDYFLVRGKGMSGYLRNIFSLNKVLKAVNYDIVHAHYSLSGYVAALAGAKPLVVSLMGSDVEGKGILSKLIPYFHKYYWSRTILKSEEMKESIQLSDLHVIPNGVDIQIFKPLSKYNCREILGWNTDAIHILFAANPNRPEKNFILFKKSFNRLLDKSLNLKFHVLNKVIHQNIPLYMNASDVVCLSSSWEGSPNVIKEAMACNRPIVCTNVGDVEFLFNDIEGCFLCQNYSIEEYSKKLEKAIQFSKIYMNTKARDRIIGIELDSKNIAKKIIKIYNSIE